MSQLAPHTPQGYEMSWLLGGIMVLLVVICFRYSRNTRYFYALVDDLTEVRVRHNAFDDTVRETSFLLLLNLIWSVCGGVMLYVLISYGSGEAAAFGSVRMVQGSALCAAVVVGYTLTMTMLYFMVGNVFSDSGKTNLWIKGYLASQGLDSIVMVPSAILSLVLPESAVAMLIVAGIAFIATKIVFIFKGFRIFFNQSASWVLFLYYLCSLEIVPLILVYEATFKLLTLLYE